MKIILTIFLLFTYIFSKNIDLSKEKTWLKLLHYDNNRSTILSREFFLSDIGYYDSKDELKKTLKLFRQNKYICRFPARYLYLSKYYKDLDSTKLLKCKKLKEWNLYKKSKNISIVFVSGFLGNPASAFGHSFFKFNNSSKDELFDTTISYGARLPKKYTMLSYIYNGLTGGYKANYTDKYYYLDEMVYSNQEFREMWKYKLVLSSFQKKLFLYHLWELQKIDFTYYFLNRNCGYKVAELLDVIYPEDVSSDAKVWYAPIETFYRLDELGYIDSIEYIPSMQQKIYAFYNGLSSQEKDIIKNILNSNLDILPKSFNSLDNVSKEKILDFVIAYKKYAKADIDSKILYTRLKLPIKEYTEDKPKIKRAITNSDKMSYLGFGAIYKNSKKYISIDYALFSLDKVGYNLLNGDMLNVFILKAYFNSSSFKVDSLNLLEIRRLNTKSLPFNSESHISWELKTGYNKIDKLFINGSIGYAWEFSSFKPYLMLQTSLNSSSEHIKLYPKVGLYVDLNRLKLNFEVGNIYDRKLKLIDKYNFSIDAQYKYTNDKSIVLKASKNSINVGLRWFF